MKAATLIETERAILRTTTTASTTMTTTTTMMMMINDDVRTVRIRPLICQRDDPYGRTAEGSGGVLGAMTPTVERASDRASSATCRLFFLNSTRLKFFK